MGKHWEMLGKPDTLEARYPDGGTNTLDMWTYWRLLEGEVYIDQPYRDARDLDPPVLHVEPMNTPVVNEETGPEIPAHPSPDRACRRERMSQLFVLPAALVPLTTKTYITKS